MTGPQRHQAERGASMAPCRGHAARVGFDPADGLFFGRIESVNDVIGFHGETMEALETAFHEAVDDYIEVLAILARWGRGLAGA